MIALRARGVESGPGAVVGVARGVALAGEELGLAFRRLDGFARNPAKHALYAAKVLLKYKLLEWQQIALADLLAWARATPYFGMLHARHFADRDQAEWLHSLADDLVRLAIQIDPLIQWRLTTAAGALLAEQ